MAATSTTPDSSPRRMSRRLPDWRPIAVCALLVGAVALVFGQTLRFDFVNIDDPIIVTEEPHVTGGFSWQNTVWAFTEGPRNWWYPLAMLSHQLDITLFGLAPWGHHLTNVLLHAASSVLLFLVLRRMTGSLWPSAVVAALFAIHPQHVESVAWVAERRDVLSGLFFMLTLGAYTLYAERPSRARYAALVGFFALGLLAKPMLVTLPPLLLLLDYWPLERFAPAKGKRKARSAFPWPLVWEKLPLLALALIAAGVTAYTQLTHPDPLSFGQRFDLAVVAYAAYIGQMFLPVGLSPFYSFPEVWLPSWQIAVSLLLLVAITCAAVYWRRAAPYFFVGWFWYAGTLIPVSELIQVGQHARADRYTYLSAIGLYIALVWGVMRLAQAGPARRWALGIGSAAVLVAFSACAWLQCGYWHDSVALWKRALACDPKNVTAHYLLGRALRDKDPKAAEAQFWKAIYLAPGTRSLYNGVRGKSQCNLGDLALRKRDYEGAVAHYREALRWYPKFEPARKSLEMLTKRR